VITVRYFAAAAEAAGATVARYEVATAGELRAAMVARHGDGLARVLARCSLVAAGIRVADDGTVLADGITVDVLPPFAGG
jgi:molybdopterin converting factor small subunit